MAKVRCFPFIMRTTDTRSNLCALLDGWIEGFEEFERKVPIAKTLEEVQQFFFEQRHRKTRGTHV